MCVALWLLSGSEENRAGEWRTPVAGLCAGLAVMTKQVFVLEAFLFLPLLIVMLKGRQVTARTVTFLLAALVPTVACAFFFARHGALPEFKLGVVGALFARGLRPDASLTSSLRAALLEDALVRLTDPAMVVLLVLGAAALVLPADRADRRPLVLAAWAVLVLGVILLQGRGYAHQFKQMLPPLALLASGAVASLGTHGPDARVSRRLVALLVAICLLAAVGLQVFSIRGTIAYIRNGRPGDKTWAQRAAVRSAILAHTGPQDRIWCFSPDSQFYYETRRLSAATHFGPYLLGLPGTADLTLRQLAQRRPRVIVVAPDDEDLRRGMTEAQVQDFLRRLHVLLDADYRMLEQDGRWQIFVLGRGAATKSAAQAPG